MNKKNFFNYLNMNLGRSNLIESSAGTGKTNIISLLYLRFLLCINLDNLYNYNINNILIVTFTDSAILEIKNRIIDNIKNLRISCIKNYVIDSKISDIFYYIKDRPNIINLLIQYENIIDKSSIFTIHSFCKKILFSYFMITKVNCFSKIINNEFELIYDLIINFWREYFYPLDNKITKIVFSYWSNPKKLFESIYNILNFIYFDFSYNIKYYSIKDCYNKIINFIFLLKKKWILNYKKLYNFLLKNNYYKFICNKKKLLYLFNEINIWSNYKNIDFYLPKFLYKLGYKYLLKIKNIKFLKNISICKLIDNVLYKIKDLYKFIIIKCFKYIKKKYFFFKKNNFLLSFNDLIIKINNLIKNKNRYFINLIRNNYPIIFIDEFQDTDFLQCNIFNKIYIQNKEFNTKIILIGDPKQSIYTFRGANIFSYIKIKKNIDFLYNFNVNWRSSILFIKSLNYLFNKINNPFIFKNIKYISVIPSNKSKFLFILKNNKIINSIKFFILNNFNDIDYKIQISKFCAIKIFNILFNKKNNYFILNKKKKRKIIASDIALLVYKNSDIKIILNVFKEFNLPINYILDKSNIFSTLEAKEIMFILKSILFPESITNICNALSTYLFDFDFFVINKYIKNKLMYVKLIKEFYDYYNIWENFGIYSLLKFLLDNRKKNKFNLYKYYEYKKNVLHIVEILEKEFYKIKDKFLLLNWLNDTIMNSNDNNNPEYYIRSSFLNCNKGINISTIHKSKGLQYNIVWIPFLVSFSKFNNLNIFYNRKNCRINNNLYDKYKKKEFFINEETLSEEMRLFYVAITRAVYQCNIILYDIKNNFYNKSFCFTPIGRLLCCNNNYNFKYFKNNIYKFINFKYITINIINLYIFFKENVLKKVFLILKKKKIFFIKKFNFYLVDNIINYSKIIHIKNKFIFNFKNKNINIYSILPKGKNIGNFFHKILEKINFSLNNYNEIILFYINKFNINKKFFFIIKRNLFNIINVILFPLNINLKNNEISFFWKEFDFIIYIKKILCFNKYNNIIKKYDNLSKLCSNINLKDKFKGFLNGFIDLIFIYKNKYYIIDYKSDWFGNNYNDYKNNNLYKIMCHHRYDIQYQIYSIALHKYLKLNIYNYDYSIHFGGIYYIFLRGLLLDNNNNSFSGLFYIKPNLNLINKLNDFFF